jgi:type IV secretory pathway VirB10-like protein
MMSEKEPEPTPAPRVQDRRVNPTGILPKNAQAWLISGIALVMVAIIALSGRSPSKDRRVTPPTPSVVDPNAARIQEYENGIEATTRRLRLQQDQLLRTQQTLSPPPPAGAAPTPYPMPGTAPGLYLRPEMQESSPDDNWIQTDKRKREYQSLFASNLVLSYRAEAHPAFPTSLPAGPSGPATTYPSLTLLGQEPASPEASSVKVGVAAAAPWVPVKQPDDEKNSGKIRAQTDPELQRAEGKLYRIFEGTVLETVLTNRLNGDFSGPVNCMVTTNVYSHDGQRLLIPQGTRVLGEVRRVETFGEQRLAVFFHRLIMPDGYSVSLDKFQGLNQVGETGLQDLVNHHYLQIFGASIAIGALAGLAQANTSYGLNESAADAYRQGVASSFSQSSMHILDRYLNVLPTFTIREGHRVKVYLAGDLLVPAYEKHQMPGDL